MQGYFEHRVINDKWLWLLLVFDGTFLSNELPFEMHCLEEVTIGEHISRSDVEVEISFVSGSI